MNYVLIGYLFLINILAYSLMGVDKHHARQNKRRVPEKVLFLLAVLGGSMGSLVGMYSFRHKTRHWYFVVGMPLILLLQLAAAHCLSR